MPATKKTAAKTAKKGPPKPAAKKAPIKAAKAAPAPKSKAAAKPDKKVAKPASPKKSPSSVKKAPAKAAKSAPPPAKKAAPAAKKAAAPAPKKAPAKKAAPAAAKKEKEVTKAAPKPAAKSEAPKKSTPPARSETAAAAPAPKAAKAAPAPKPAPAAKTAPAPKSAPGKATGAPINGGTKIATVRRSGRAEDEGITLEAPKKPILPSAFLKRQRQRLIELRDAYLNSAEGVANDQLRNANEGGEASAFGMHQADAGSDAYDRDFALSLLAKEQDAIYEINEALKRIDIGTYGLCEMSGNIIPEERLEALPFTRFTVQCQERIEREQMGGRWNRPVRSLFGLDESAEDSDEERDEEESSSNSESLDFAKE